MSNVFVGGCVRSGTNLMHLVLCQHAGANPMIHEAVYLTRMIGVYRWAKLNLDNNTRDYFGDAQGLRRFHASLLARFLALTRDLHGNPDHLVLKHPQLTWYFPDLFELERDCRFVCMVRDPRDTVASMKRVAGKMAAAGRTDSALVGRDVAALCDHYKSYYRPVLECADPDFRAALLFVRYEDLVDDPYFVLELLARFTGMDLGDVELGSGFDHGRVDYAARSERWDPWFTELYGKPISRSRVGSHAETLTAAEIATIERRCASAFRTFGYAV